MIDKDELIEIIKYSSKWNKPCPKWVYKAIKATPEKTGKWRNASSLFYIYECSECKKIADNDYDYCPHCGTKMIEKEF